MAVHIRANLLVGHDHGDLSPQITQRDRVMLLVVGTDAFTRQHNGKVALIGIDCGHADASMGIDPREDNCFGS